MSLLHAEGNMANEFLYFEAMTVQRHLSFEKSEHQQLVSLCDWLFHVNERPGKNWRGRQQSLHQGCGGGVKKGRYGEKKL